MISNVVCSRYIGIFVAISATLNDVCLCITYKASIAGKNRVDVEMFLTATDWFSARQHCKDAGYDDLDDAPLGSHTHIALAQLLQESGGLSGQSKFWTYFHRPYSNSTWVQIDCRHTTRVNVNYGDGEECVAVSFSTSYVPSHSAEVCTLSLPFLCLNKIGPVDWIPPDFNTMNDYPATWTRVTTTKASKMDCQSVCTGQCVVYSYSETTNTCDMYNLTNNEAYGSFTVSPDSTSTISTAGRQGVNVTLHPITVSISQAPQNSPCAPVITTTLFTTHPTSAFTTTMTEGPTWTTAGSTPMPDDLTSTTAGSTPIPNDLTSTAAGSTPMHYDLTSTTAGSTPMHYDLTSTTAGSTPMHYDLTSTAAVSTPMLDDLTSTTAGSTPMPDDLTSTAAGSNPMPDDLTPITAGSTPVSDDLTSTAAVSTPIPNDLTPTTAGSTPMHYDLTSTAAVSSPMPDDLTPTTSGSTPMPDDVTPTSTAAVSSPMPDDLTPTTAGSTPMPDDVTPTTAGSTPTKEGLTPTTEGSTVTTAWSTQTIAWSTRAIEGSTKTTEGSKLTTKTLTTISVSASISAESTTSLPPTVTSITTSPETATEATTDNLPITLEITGYTGQYSYNDMHVYMEPVTWLEAVSICRTEIEGRLAAYMPLNSTSRIERLSTLLVENGAYPDVSLWVSVFRQEVDNKWYKPSCSVFTGDIVDNGGNCAYMRFYDKVLQPQLSSANCTEKRPYVCAKNIDPVTFTKYRDYTHLNDISQNDDYTINRTLVNNVSQCLDNCLEPNCVGVTFLDVPGEQSTCVSMLATEGRIYVYNVTRHDNAIHYVKNGFKGTFHPASKMSGQYGSVASTPPATPTDAFRYCSPTNITTTKPSVSTPSPPPPPILSSPLQSPPPKVCSCKLDSGVCPKLAALEPVALRAALEQLVTNLTLARDATSSHRRRLVSVRDPRRSSSYIGAAAVVCLSLIGGVIVLSDVVNVLAGMNCRGRAR